jgi:hypothetical protein
MKNRFVILFVLFTQLVQAQGTELGLALGASFYSGDLTPDEFGLFVNDLEVAYGAFVRFHPADRIGLRLAFNGARVSGDDINGAYPSRGLNFRTSIMELALMAEVETFRIGDIRGGNYFTAYLFGGGGFFRFEPETLFEGAYIALQPIGTEGQGLPLYPAPYQLTQFNVPFGGGVKYVINDQFVIGLELGGRKLFTDYLDDVGQTVVSYNDLRQGKGDIAAQLSYPNWEELGSPEQYKRGGEYNDWYFIGNLTLSYFLNNEANRRANGRGGENMGCYSFGKKRRR